MRILMVVLFLLGPGSIAFAGSIEGTVMLFGKGREDAAVHLVDVKGTGPPSKARVVMNQKQQSFIPRVLPVYKGTTVHFPNNDTVFHNAFSLSQGNGFNLGTYGPGKNPSTEFPEPGKVDVFCNMHEQMHALVIVLEHPHFTQTSKKGRYQLKDIPEGSYRIRAWVSPSISKEVDVVVQGSDPVVLDFELKQD